MVHTITYNYTGSSVVINTCISYIRLMLTPFPKHAHRE